MSNIVATIFTNIFYVSPTGFSSTDTVYSLAEKMAQVFGSIRNYQDLIHLELQKWVSQIIRLYGGNPKALFTGHALQPIMVNSVYLVISGIVIFLSVMVCWIIYQRLNRRIKQMGAFLDQIDPELQQTDLPLNRREKSSEKINRFEDILRALKRKWQETEARYLVLMEQNSDGIALVEIETRTILDSNKAFWNLLKIPAGEQQFSAIENYLLQGNNLNHEVIIPQTEWPSDKETDLVYPSGATLNVEMLIRPVNYNGREIQYIIVRNIEEQLVLQSEVQRQLRELLLLNRVIAAASSALETRTIFTLICTELSRTFDVPQAAAGLLDETRENLKIVAEYCTDGRPSALDVIIPVATNPATARVIELATPVVVRNAQTDPEVEGFHEIAKMRGTVSLLIVPLIVRNQVVGTLGLDAVEQREFTQDEINLAQNVAKAASQALENALLYTELQYQVDEAHRVEAEIAKRERYLAALVDVQRILLSTGSTDDFYPVILGILGQAAYADFVYVYENYWDVDGELFTKQKSVWARDDTCLNHSGSIDLSYQTTLKRWRPILEQGNTISGKIEEFSEEELTVFKNENTPTLLILPLQVSGQFFGFLAFSSEKDSWVWETTEIGFLRVAAVALSMAYQRNLAEQKTDQASSELRAVFNAFPDIYFRLSRDGTYLDYHSAKDADLYSSPSEFLGKKVSDVIPGEAGTLVMDAIQRALGEKHLVSIEYSLPDQESVKEFDARISPIGDEQVIAIVRNISERKDFEKELLESRTSLLLLIDQLPAVLWTTDLGLKITSSLGLGLRLLDLNPGEINGQNIFEFFKITDDQLPIVQAHQKALANESVSLEVSLEEHIFQIFLKPFVDTDGNTIGTIGLGLDITDRKLVETELQTQRDFALQVMTTMGQGLTVTNAEGRYDFVNPAFARMLGYKPEMLIGRTPADITYPEDIKKIEDAVNTRKAGRIHTYEIRLRRADGLPTYVMITGVPRWREDRIVGSISVVTDLTERMRNEDALRKSENKYRSVVENVKEVIFQTTVTGRWAYLNQAWGEITGHPVDDTIGMEFINYIFPSDRERVIEEFRRLVDRETEDSQYEVRYLTNDGKFRWFDVSARVMLDLEGLVVGTSGILTDTTERKIAEFALRKSEESIRALYNITSAQKLSFSEKMQALLIMGCQHFGLDTGILSNIHEDIYEVVEIYSINSETVPGKTFNLSETYCHETIHEDAPVGFINAGQSGWAQHPCYISTGIEAYIGSPVSVSGNVYGTLNFFSLNPRTEQFSSTDKEFLRLMAQWIGGEIEREQYTEQLQTYADEIVKKNEALGEARDQALEGSRLKSEFLATMSHEIRTPMNAVIGMTELLMDTPLVKEQSEYVGIVHDSANVLLTLINDILDFSKIEAGKVVLENIPFNLISVIEGAVELFASTAREKGLELLVDASPDLPVTVKGDPIRLRQVLFNLIGNAVKFTSKGEILVQAELEQMDNENVRLSFKVKDTGIGLSDVARKRLFQPFTQADGSTTRKYGGTGLGLAISKSLVSMMGGEIGVDSIEGQGSTFWFTVQLGFSQSENDKQPRPLPDGIQTVPILVVVENNTQRNIIVQYINHWKLSTNEAQTAGEALEFIKQASHDATAFMIILVDRHLSNMDAMEFARKVSEIGQPGSVRLILLSPFDERSSAEQSLSQGFSAYLLKPIKQSLLFDAIITTFSESVEKNISSPTKTTKPQKYIDVDLDGGTILLAEDNVANQKLAMVQLKKLGFTTQTVKTGRQAVEAVVDHTNQFVLVLMDCQMPEMDGFDATRMIRKVELSTGGHIPIIAMTANAMQGDRDNCIAVGMDDYISKPVNLESLQQVISKWANKSLSANITAAVSNRSPVEMVGPLDIYILDGIRQLQSEDDPSFLADLIETYFKDSQRLLVELSTAIESQDGQKLRRAAHSLKGTSVNLGARLLGAYCSELEEYGANSRFTEARDWLTNVEQEYERVRTALENEI